MLLVFALFFGALSFWTRFVFLLLWLLCCFSALVASVDVCCCLVYCDAFVAVQSALLRNLHTLVFHMFFSCTNTLDRQVSMRFAHMYVMVMVVLRRLWEKSLKYSTAYTWCLQDAIKPTFR